MRRFGRFVGHSLARGAEWLFRVSNPLLYVVSVLALFGVAIVISLPGLPIWLLIQVATFVLLAMFAAGAYREWDSADRRVPVAEGPPSSPNPMTVLTWTGSDYAPAAAKSWDGPKTFIGPVDPNTVPGVANRDHDMWMQFGTTPREASENP